MPADRFGFSGFQTLNTVYSQFMKYPGMLPRTIDQATNTYYLIWLPKKFAYAVQRNRYPDPGHSALIQTHNGQVVLNVNNMPGKTALAGSQSWRRLLDPAINRMGGSDAENLVGELHYEEHGSTGDEWRDNLQVPLHAGGQAKHSGPGTLLDCSRTFNTGHELQVVKFTGLPLIKLSPELLKKFSTYDLIGNNCHHASLSSWLQIFRDPSGRRLEAPQVIGELFTAEVSSIVFNQSQLMNTLPSLAAHRVSGLRSERNWVDLDDFFTDTYTRGIKMIQNDDSLTAEKKSEFRSALVEPISKRVLSEIAPELQNSLNIPSHKEGNPPPDIVTAPATPSSDK